MESNFVNRFFILCVLILMIGVAGVYWLLIPMTSVQAATETVTVTAVADTVVSEDPSVTLTDESALLATDSVSYTASYLRFDAPVLAGDLVSATLRLYAQDTSRDPVSLYLVTDNNWKEATLTSTTNVPATGALITTVSSHFLRTWIEFDVTGYVTAGELVSFLIETDNGDYITYNSSEAAENQPQLLLTSNDDSSPTQTPLPTTAATSTPTTPTPPPTTAPTSTAAPPQGEGETIVVTAVADVTVSDDPNYITNAEDQLIASKRLSETVSYIRFDVPAFSGELPEATLRLYAQSTVRDVLSIHYVANNEWQETGLTFENKPPIGDLVGTVPDHFLRSWVEIDVSNYVTSDAFVSFRIYVDSDDLVSYSSSEAGEDGPQLVISTTSSNLATATPPPPGPTATPGTPDPTGTPAGEDGDGRCGNGDCVLNPP